MRKIFFDIFISSENKKKIYHLGDLRIDGMIILKLDLKGIGDLKMLARFKWLRVSSSGGLL
jgi:hypothetical protein